jgi:UDP-GlcNAc:undecaprenyl-phosphate GlcNAc-1-phosphate transferase
VLKQDEWNLAAIREHLLAMLAVLTPTTVISFTLFGMYRGSWRLAGIDDFRRLCLAVVCGSFSGLALLGMIVPWKVPFSLFGVYTFIALVLANGARVSYRLAEQARMRASIGGVPTLIYGAGLGGASAVREMLSNSDVGLTPVGFIDDHPVRAGKFVNGYPILGNVDQLDSALAHSAARVIVVSSRKIPDERVAQVRRICEARGLRLLRMHFGFEEVDPEPSPVLAGTPPTAAHHDAPRSSQSARSLPDSSL